jgi:spermidine synthase
VDEYRYHEALIHPVLAALPSAKHILVMGGGDGLAVREILKYPQIQTVTLVDLDKEMTKLFRSNEMLLKLNKRSLLSPRVTVINEDAFSWARTQLKTYDAIIIDFPDPSNYSVGKLYTNTFYGIVKHLLKADGIIVVQSTSPYVAPKSYWTVEKTLQSVGFYTVPYHNYVPSFGEWGYIMAMNSPVYKVPEHYVPGLRFMSKPCLEQMLYFPRDMARVPAPVNRLNNQILVKYFEDEWSTVL